jgi:GTPase SAR1 family protein
VFLLCFSVDNIHSYHNIIAKWQPEIKYHCPKAPYILVGTKTDLRPVNGVNNITDSNVTKEYISKSMGKKLANKIKAFKYVESSAKNMSGVTEVFNIQDFDFCSKLTNFHDSNYLIDRFLKKRFEVS